MGFTILTIMSRYICCIFFYREPNANKFVVPEECLTNRHRSIVYGISATSGNIESIIDQVGSGIL